MIMEHRRRSQEAKLLGSGISNWKIGQHSKLRGMKTALVKWWRGIWARGVCVKVPMLIRRARVFLCILEHSIAGSSPIAQYITVNIGHSNVKYQGFSNKFLYGGKMSCFFVSPYRSIALYCQEFVWPGLKVGTFPTCRHQKCTMLIPML